MRYDYVLYATDAGIATVTLNRPDKLNALYGTMREEIVDALKSASADPSVRAVIVTGAGRGFCAGGDIAYMQELMALGDVDSFRGLVAAGAEVVRTVRACPKPVVAAVNGAAAGGGMNLALACDFRIAATTARFSQAFVKIAMHPDWGGTYLLPRLVGLGRALEMMMTGRSVGAEEALAIGLVTRLVAPERLAEEARVFAADLAASAPLAVAEIKKNLYASFDRSVEDVLRSEIETQLRLFKSADAREGMAAFREKRSPAYRGV